MDCIVELKWDDDAQRWCAWYRGALMGVGRTKGRALRIAAIVIDMQDKTKS